MSIHISLKQIYIKIKGGFEQYNATEDPFCFPKSGVEWGFGVWSDGAVNPRLPRESVLELPLSDFRGNPSETFNGCAKRTPQTQFNPRGKSQSTTGSCGKYDTGVFYSFHLFYNCTVSHL